MSVKTDELKHEVDNQIVLDTLLKIETNEAKMIYILTQNFNHPLQSKAQFRVGIMNVYYENNKTIQCLKGEITSLQCLNQEVLDWDQRYFDKIKLALETGGKDFKYSLKPANEENPSDIEQILKITEKICLGNSKKQVGSDVTVIKVKLKLQPQSCNLDSLFSLFNEINNRKKNKIEALEKNLSFMDKQRQDLLKELENSNSNKKYTEEQLRNKFLVLLNEKKRKIRELLQQLQEPQQNQLMNQIQMKQEEKQKQKEIDQNFFIEADEEIVGGSQCILSQPSDFGTLFEQTLQQDVQVGIKRRNEAKAEEFKKPVSKQEQIQIKKETQQILDEEIEHVDIDEFYEEPRKRIK